VCKNWFKNSHPFGKNVRLENRRGGGGFLTHTVVMLFLEAGWNHLCHLVQKCVRTGRMLLPPINSQTLHLRVCIILCIIVSFYVHDVMHKHGICCWKVSVRPSVTIEYCLKSPGVLTYHQNSFVAQRSSFLRLIIVISDRITPITVILNTQDGIEVGAFTEVSPGSTVLTMWSLWKHWMDLSVRAGLPCTCIPTQVVILKKKWVHAGCGHVSLSVWEINLMQTFRKRLKLYLFQLSYPGLVL